MKDYTKALDNDGWAEHYNMNLLHSVVSGVQNGNVSVWSNELLKITKEGEHILEIGCGSGASSLWLAKNKRIVTALDYTESSVDLVNAASKELGISINTIVADATQTLPFEENQFDMIFQAGLLEHFSYEEQIALLGKWKKYCKQMVSMIPNKASIPYRVGKQIMETNGTWEYGLEMPKHTFASEFEKAGIKVIDEYTIGTEWALGFLPKRHYIRTLYEKMMKQGFNLDDLMQGYLLVTIGEC